LHKSFTKGCDPPGSILNACLGTRANTMGEGIYFGSYVAEVFYYGMLCVHSVCMH